jgi:hypothetical protein
MRYRLLAALAVFALWLAPVPKASAATSFSFSLRIGDPYIGPQLAFYDQPDVVVIPGTRVYYIDDYDYDLYRYGNYWYYYWNGGWYRSIDYDGPFYFISYVSVPYSIRYVPVRYRHHWRNYRGAAYSSYRAGRYYPSNPGSYTYYRTRYENRYPQTRGQYSVQQSRYRQSQQPVQQYRQPQTTQREQYRRVEQPRVRNEQYLRSRRRSVSNSEPRSASNTNASSRRLRMVLDRKVERIAARGNRSNRAGDMVSPRAMGRATDLGRITS